MKEFLCLMVLLTLITISNTSYLEFELHRFQIKNLSFHKQPISCINQSNISSDAEYRQICYEKDIAFAIPFYRNHVPMMISADFTVPISWLKGEDCKIQGTDKDCSRVIQNWGQKLSSTKNKLINKIKRHKKQSHQKENSIIQGSSEIIKGQIENTQDVTFVTKSSSRLSNFYQIMMLGLFIYGQEDNMCLEKTNFINATSLSPTTNQLVDGAISLRFDQSSQNSFINQIFAYVKAQKKTVSIYLGTNSTLTIGDLTTKYTFQGYSGVSWVSMPDDEGYGKLAQVSAVGLDLKQDDEHEQDDQTIAAVVTLSASYIGIPQNVTTDIIKSYKKYADCTINNTTFYLECKIKNKKKQLNLYFKLDGHNLILPLSSLILQQRKGTTIFNIKKTYNNRIILGEPIFRYYTLIFDYSNDKIGFSKKRQAFETYFISVVSLVRLLFMIFIFGCLGTACYNPIRNCLRDGRNRSDGLLRPRRKQYAPIQQNPYQDLNSKIRDAISSTDRQVDGI